MNFKRFCAGIVLVTLLWFLIPAGGVHAIGQWHEGIVTKKAWLGKYIYIKIDKVKYTIMKGTRVQYVYEKEGSTYKNDIKISSILPGDHLIFKVSGNRIYNIEKSQ